MGDKLPIAWTRLRSCFKSTFVEDHVIGFDFAGNVVRTYTSTYSVGDQVFGNIQPFQGRYAEYITVPFDQVWHMPLCYYDTWSKTKIPLSFAQPAAMPLVR
jgi:NADPH:quinone reductase-like Zn-dependent oxidoreductase